MKFQGKVCLVTGGAAGIGRATAAKFLAEGASVVICDVNEAAGQAAAAALGAGARFDVVNVADSAAVQAWVADVAAAYGRIDVLVNNAGITRDAQLIKYKNGAVVDQMSAAAWDAVQPSHALEATWRLIRDANALLEALDSGKLAGAGLDVFEPEPVALDSRLRDHERVIATPHIAGVTADGRTRMEQMAVERVLAFFGGERPENVVNPEVYSA